MLSALFYLRIYRFHVTNIVKSLVKYVYILSGCQWFVYILVAFSKFIVLEIPQVNVCNGKQGILHTDKYVTHGINYTDCLGIGTES